MLKLLAAALIASAAMIGTIRLADADPVTITFRFNDTEEEMRAALDASRTEPGHQGRPAAHRLAGRAQPVPARGRGRAGARRRRMSAQVWVKEMGEAGATLPLNDLMKKAPPPNGFADFVAQELAQGKDGKIYGLPWTTDTWAMVYRTDLLKEAGITKLPTTWDRAARRQRAVNKQTGKTGFGFPAGSSASGAIWFLANFYWWSNGKSMVVREAGRHVRDGPHRRGHRRVHALLQVVHQRGRQPDVEPQRQRRARPGDPAGAGDRQAGHGRDAAEHLQAGARSLRGRQSGQARCRSSRPVPARQRTKSSMIGGRMLVINANTKHPDERGSSSSSSRPSRSSPTTTDPVSGADARC